MKSLRQRHLTEAYFIHRDADGRVLWESEGWIPNFLADEGEKDVLDVYLRGASAPTSFRVRLFADTPVETDSLASLAGEPGGSTGYVSPTVNRDATQNGWLTLENAGGDFRAATRTLTFRCTGPNAYPAIQYAALCTTSDNTGKLVDATALTQSRALKSGETLDLVYRPSLS